MFCWERRQVRRAYKVRITVKYLRIRMWRRGRRRDKEVSLENETEAIAYD